jgi:hypothetical protein
VDLPQPRGTDRLAVGDQPAVGVDRHGPVDLGGAVGQQLLLVAVGAEPGLGHVDDLGAGVGVLQLDDVDVLGPDARGLEGRPRRVHGRRDVLLDRGGGGVHLVGAEAPGPDLGRLQVHRLGREPVGDVPAAHDDRRGTLVGRAEHVLGERVVQDRRRQDVLFGHRLAPEGVRVARPVPVVLGGDLGQRRLRDAVVVDVLVGLHPEELGGDELPVLGVPPRQRQLGRVVGEGAPGVLVEADGDPDVVLAQPDRVGAHLGGGGGRGAGVEHVGERDAGEAHEPRDGVGVGHLVAAAHAELDVAPLDPGVAQRRVDGVGAHLHRRLAVEPPERVQAHPDDRDLVHPDSPSSPAPTGRNAHVTISVPSSST